MSKKLTIKEAQQRLGLPRSTTYRLLAHEPGVLRIVMPGRKKPIVRVGEDVIDRIILRSANRAS